MKPKTVNDANRRSIMLYLRVTKAEKQKLEVMCEESGLTLSQWIRSRAIDVKPIIRKALPGEETMIKMLWHISKVGTNLNMVARQLNRKQDSPEFDMPLTEINTLSAELKSIAATIRNTLHEHHKGKN